MLSLIKNNLLSPYKGLPLLGWHAISISFLESILSGICYFFSIYLVNILKLSIVESGIIISCYGIGTILGGFFAGKMCDQFSPNLIRMISLVIQSSAFCFLCFNTSFYLLMINFLLLGIGCYGFITSNHLLVLNLCIDGENQRLKAISILDIAANLGLSIAGILISFLPLHLFNNVCLLIGLILFFLTIFIFFNKQPFINQQNINISYNQNAFVSEKYNNKKYNFIIVSYTLLSLFLVGLIISQINSNYPLYLQKKFLDWGSKSFGMLLTLNSILVVFLQAPIVNFIDRFNKIVVIGLGSFLLGFGMLMLNFGNSFNLALLYCVIFTIGEIFFFAVAQIICYERAANDKKGFTIGLYRTIYACSRVSGPVLGSILLAQSTSLLWYACGMIGIIIFLPSLFIQKYN